jgi:hypothetical protein
VHGADSVTTYEMRYWTVLVIVLYLKTKNNQFNGLKTKSLKYPYLLHENQAQILHFYNNGEGTGVLY